MLNNLKIFVFLLLASFSVILPSCSNEKRVAEGKPLKNRTANAVLTRYNKNLFEFDYVGMRISAEVKNADDNQSFKANVRMRKDSIIWISITPLMGVEMIRAVITPDSVKYVSKVPNNKHYFLGTLHQLTDITKNEITFEMLQAVLVGNAIDINEEEDKFTSRIDGNEYVLISKYKRKMKKVLGVNDRDVQPSDSLSIDASDRQYRRILRRSDEDDLLLKRYWFDGYDYHLVRTVFDDLYYQRSVTINHSDFEVTENLTYPKQTSVSVTSEKGSAQFSFEITRLKIDKDYEFPFEIPEDYERRLIP
ncbi:MAG: DUF4292 domain-containing protein [Flavobacteriales bacterium]|jgi:hypothetical protein|nr:DUF4292 domain-containing protein [Flavobacteriales bacterium]